MIDTYLCTEFIYFTHVTVSSSSYYYYLNISQQLHLDHQTDYCILMCTWRKNLFKHNV